MRKKSFILLGLAMLFVSTDICAEEDRYSAVKAIDLEPITITASRTRRRLLEAPSSVSIVTEKEIKDANAKSVPDLLKDTKGIYMYDSSGVGTSGTVNMRGFWGSMSTHYLVLKDGIPQNKGKDKDVDWDLIPLDNIERIEIVRGPASSLYGDNAMSGVINIITKRPSAIPETAISTSYGSFNTRNYKVSTSGVFKRIGYRLGISSKLTDGFRKHSDYDRTHIDTRLDYNIDDVQKVQFLLDHYEKKRGAHSWALSEAQIAEDRRQARPGTENDKSEETKSDISITHIWDISNNVKTEGAFYYKNNDADLFYTSGSTESTTKEQLEDEDAYGILLKGSLNQEIMGLQHEFTAGIDLERDNFDYQEYRAPYQQRGALQKDYGVKRDKIGPYLQDEIRLIDSLRLTGGIRYDQVDFDFDDHKVASNSKTKKMSKLTPRCGLVYMYQKDSSLYANYAQAFRTPTINQMFASPTAANPDLNPEKATNYETGIQHHFNDYLKANVSLYWMKLDNEIAYDYATRKYNNYGKTSHKGVESSLDFKLIKGISGFANYTYTRAKNESGDYGGKYLANIPIHKGSFGLMFETEFGLKVNLAITRIGDAYIDDANNDKLSGYTTVDTKVAYKHKWWSVFLAIDNLLDKEYNSYGYKSGTTKYFNPAPERTFTFGAEVNF